ncbi:MAG: type II toxin-antitoxin system VapB family antitoxin [Deltaproteobacteria bacterium]|jgi:hypothetical protein|nr:type II toxin-antitoxin system VapB family antitoxin [Deltaproteobacteria bacterium]
MVSGENLTQAVIQALEERLELLRGRRTTTNTVQEIMAISQRCSSLPEQDHRSTDEILGYNQIGIPG